MIDHFCIFTKGGVVLFSTGESLLSGSPHPVDALIRNVLLEERSHDTSYIKDSYAIRWSFANELDLIFVVVYQKVLQLLYIDDLLKTVSQYVADNFQEEITKLEQFEFEENFQRVLKEAEDKVKTQRKNVPRPFQKKKDGGSESQITPKKEKEKEKPAKVVTPSQQEASEKANGTLDDMTDEERAAQMKKNADKIRARLKGGKGKNQPASPTVPKDSPKPVKHMAVSSKVNAKEARSLDVNKSVRDEDKEVEAFRQQFGGREGTTVLEYEETYSDEEEDSEDEDDQTGNQPGTGTGAKSKGWFTWMQSLTGNKPFEKEDLLPVMEHLKSQLVTKNVAEDTADKLCESVAASLIGKKPASTFKGAKATFREAMEDALTRILTPKRNIDILRSIKEAKRQGRPYVIVFCGVNGVGKSTNLAKVCKWILDNDFSVLVAACDTFRSGAVEQLRVHSRCLDVPIYEKGYNKDPAGIAKDAISAARSQKKDVVLVDTAGRMQDNEPLMRALAKLVHVNEPDLVVFVGEALVGNDGVEQLTGFNKAMIDFSPATSRPREIDGILLTKFDTIDDKVGAAVSMVCASGQPILFVGTGQTYTDLKKMNVRTVVKALLK